MIYTLEKDNVPVYVGKTTTPLNKRLYSHRTVFNDKELQILALDDDNSSEEFWIQQLLSWGFPLRNKISTGYYKPPNYGKKMSLDQVLKLKQAKRPEHTEEQKIKISESMKRYHKNKA